MLTMASHSHPVRLSLADAKSPRAASEEGARCRHETRCPEEDVGTRPTPPCKGRTRNLTGAGKVSPQTFHQQSCAENLVDTIWSQSQDLSVFSSMLNFLTRCRNLSKVILTHKSSVLLSKTGIMILFSLEDSCDLRYV